MWGSEIQVFMLLAKTKEHILYFLMKVKILYFLMKVKLELVFEEWLGFKGFICGKDMDEWMKTTYVSRLNLLGQKICTGIVAKKKKKIQMKFQVGFNWLSSKVGAEQLYSTQTPGDTEQITQYCWVSDSSCEYGSSNNYTFSFWFLCTFISTKSPRTNAENRSWFRLSLPLYFWYSAA